LLFVAVLTVVYLVILLFNDKSRGYKRRLKMKTANISMLGAYASMILLVVFQSFWNTSLFYFLLYPITVFLLVIAVIKSSNANQKYLLVISVVLLHLIILSKVFPSFGVRITERIPALAKLDFAKTWNPEWQMLDVYYDPFPMDLGLFYVFSNVTGLNYINLSSQWIVNLIFAIAYDLILFSLVKEVSGDWKAGVLGVLLFAFTPPAAINPQPQWFANLFILVFLLALFRSLRDSPSISSIVLVYLSYSAAILFHGTAAIGAVVVSVLLLLMYFGRRLGVNVAATARHRSFLFVVSISVYVITFGRWLFLGGLQAITNPLMGVYADIFGHGQTSWIGAEYVPLYDQFVSPIIAYAWSIPISLALAFVLYHVITRFQKKSLSTVLTASLSVAAAGLAFGGFLGSLFSAHENLQRYLGYASLVLFIPAAATTIVKVLRFSPSKLMVIGLVSIVLFSVIGVCDPEFSPQLYKELQTVNPARSADLVEGKTLYTILSDGTSVFSTYETLAAFSYVKMGSEFSEKLIYFYGSLKTHRIMIERLMEEGEATSDATYIWSSEILVVAANVSVNVVYDSGRHVAVKKAG
jgi:hypothetical protein